MIDELLTSIAERPSHEWRRALETRWPDDPDLVHQALVWLRADRAAAYERPALPGGRYELEILLDQGATASVWRGYDRKLRRDVAIKVFHDRAKGVNAILAEARAACDVISDHVVRVYDVHDADPPYLVMELVGEYEPRSGALELGASSDGSRPLDPTEVARWLGDVARGVRDAHLRNVFHRDLKPANVLITPISRRAKIADFGLATTRGAQATGLVFRRGLHRRQIAGTPSFMAPEQARGLPATAEPRDPDHHALLSRVDVWGLGAIAFAWLTGGPPWTPTDAEEPWELAARACPPRVPARMHTGERIPRALRQIVQRALSPNANDRYATADEVACELDAFLARRPTSFDRTRVTRTLLWGRRNPHHTATVLVALILASLTIGARLQIERMRHQRTALVDDVHELEDDLKHRAEVGRRELAAAEAKLDARTTALAKLEQTLTTAQAEYNDVLTAKDEELRTADSTTRQLASELTAIRGDRDLTQALLAQSRRETDGAVRERDGAQRERDGARAERDKALAERDKARAEQARLEHEREALRAERDRQVAARLRAEADLARLAEQLGQLVRGPPDRTVETREGNTGALH